MTTSFDLELRRGTTIIGKWKQARYRVDRLLGEGANGKVYLVQRDRAWFAMKLGFDSIDLQSEINVLKLLADKQSALGTQLVDVDKLFAPDGKEYSYYVMRYVRGVTAADYLLRQGVEWLPLAALNLLDKLSKLHAAGWIFGDLKAENVMVSDYGRVELVDFGGATEIGKSIRQFTEVYDRGYWNAGSRSADSAYDLFSFGVLCIHLLEPGRLMRLSRQLLPQNRSAADLMQLVNESQALKPVSAWLSLAFTGGFANTEEATALWKGLLQQKETKSSVAVPGWLKGLAVISGMMLIITLIWWLGS